MEQTTLTQPAFAGTGITSFVGSFSLVIFGISWTKSVLGSGVNEKCGVTEAGWEEWDLFVCEQLFLCNM